MLRFSGRINLFSPNFREINLLISWVKVSEKHNLPDLSRITTVSQFCFAACNFVLLKPVSGPCTLSEGAKCKAKDHERQYWH
jgi:hypothetical protein